MINPLICCDFYKVGHRQQYPQGTTKIVSNFTPRFNKHANVGRRDKIVFFGLQYFITHFLKNLWNAEFFDKPKEEVVRVYKRRMDTSLGKDSVPVDHIAALHDLRYLPITIRSVPEGSLVPIGVPCLTIENTHDEFFWLTNYLETVLSAYLWSACTSATTAFNFRKLFDKYSTATGSPPEFTDFQGHDFSFRGMSSVQSAIISGAGHLLSFKGTDTIPAIDFMEDYYFANSESELIGASVPATEHSVMCMSGESDEIETFRHLIEEIYPKSIVSIVSDTWDFWKVLTEYALALKDKIISREGKVVFRPDSGDPADILCGDRTSYAKETGPTPQHKGAVEVLWEIFGGTITSTGHKLLDSHVGLIYGDSIDYKKAEEILERLQAKGFASANVVFGIGSYTYQYVTRDTWGWAVKATYGVVNGEERNIFKCPKTDDGGKKSAKGLLVVKPDFTLTQEASWAEFTSEDNLLQPVFEEGQLVKKTSLSDIRKKLHETA